MSDKIQIRITLEGELKEKFEKIKADLGLENNSEVIRFLINEKYKQLFGKG